ncbi:MAG: hypothetical protein WKF96_08515 [Solirubrobacteraceae bacterium]
MDEDKEFDYLREQSPEQREAADDVEPRIEDAPETGAGQDKDGETVRENQAGL